MFFSEHFDSALTVLSGSDPFSFGVNLGLLLSWDTAEVPGNKSIVAAWLRTHVYEVLHEGGKSLIADWYDWSADECEATDYEPEMTPSALSVEGLCGARCWLGNVAPDYPEGPAGFDFDFPLDGADLSIDRTGTSYMRLHIRNEPKIRRDALVLAANATPTPEANPPPLGPQLILLVCEEPFVCGNGDLEPGESCDDGGAEDGCPASCIVDFHTPTATMPPTMPPTPTPTITPTPQCGNNIVDAGETCDGCLSCSDPYACTEHTQTGSAETCDLVCEYDVSSCAAGFPNDPLFQYQWALSNVGQTYPTSGSSDSDIDALEAWGEQTDCRDVIVAVMDTGIDFTHPDLIDNIIINTGEIPGDQIDNDDNGFVDDVHGWDFWNNDNDPSDDLYHGTLVSGVIGATGNNGIGTTGVCWQARILPIKVLPATFHESCQLDRHAAAFANGIDYAIAMGAKVINISFPIIKFGRLGGGIPTAPSEMTAAISRAEAAGVMLVVAFDRLDLDDLTGIEINDEGLSLDELVNPGHPVWEEIGYILGIFPQYLRGDNIITVTGSDAKDELPPETWYGPTMVDLAAPAGSIYTTTPIYPEFGHRVPFYKAMPGGSMAAPQVTAAVAHLLVRHATLTPVEIRQAILDSTDRAEEAGSQGLGTLYGKVVSNGRLNLHKVVTWNPPE